MIRASINQLIGVDVSLNYPWKDTLFIYSGIASFGQEDYEKCRAFISIKKCRSINVSDCRQIGEGLYINHNTLVDTKYGVRLERSTPNHIKLVVSQECNEWLVICIQLLLLELNCTLIHGAALEREGEVLLLPSWGGVGKTATVISMVRDKGWNLLGDDLVILKNNKILPFLKPFVIYPYHKPLFPEVFHQYNGRVITNLKFNRVMNKMIPVTKRILRYVPGILAFARRHNPQSIRISPKKVFEQDALSEGGTLKNTIWLERILGDSTNFTKKEMECLASKTASVSIMEIFADRFPCVLALCGTGLLDYNDVFVKMYQIIASAYQDCHCYELDIPITVEIKEVGMIVINHLETSGICKSNQIIQ